MKRLEFDVKHGHYAHPDGRYVTYDDAIALARIAVDLTWKIAMGRGTHFEGEDAYLREIDFIIAEAEKS